MSETIRTDPKTMRHTWTYDEYARLPDDGNRHEVIAGEVSWRRRPRRCTSTSSRR